MTNQLAIIGMNSFVECRDVIEKTHPIPALISNISDSRKLVNDRKIENTLVKGSSICYHYAQLINRLAKHKKGGSIDSTSAN